LAAVAPLPADQLMIAWWAMRPDPKARQYVGPPVFFDGSSYTAPMLPTGGVSTSEAVALYFDAAPVKCDSPVGFAPRIPLRAYRDPPELWRRAVTAPMRADAEAQLRALPSPERLARWYHGVCADWWRRFVLHRFVADAAAGAIRCYGGRTSGLGRGAQDDGCGVPTSFFRSDVELEPERGAIFGVNDRRLPLVQGMRFHRADDIPPEVTAELARRQDVGRRASATNAARRARPVAEAAE
jgi:hypothetical protein